MEDDSLSKIFSQDFRRPFAKLESDHGETVILKLTGRYYGKGPVQREKISFSAKFKGIGNYSQNLLSQPVNDEHRLSQRGDHLTLDSLLVKYNSDWLTASVFEGDGHSDWREDGDLFNLFPEQFDVYNYKRVSGRRVPRGGEITVRSPLGNVQLVTGCELVWGGGESVIGKWNYRLGGIDIAAFYSDEKIVWGRKGERLRGAELSFRARPDKFSLWALAILYRPFRLNWPYTFTEDVEWGQGFQGTKYKIHEAHTRCPDALGATTKYERSELPFSLKVYTIYTYCGLVAGNKSELSLGLEKMYAPSLNLLMEFTYRVPLKGPNPQIFEGTVDNNGPILFSPRGPDDPFWVNSGNRKAYLLSFTLLYDPTPETWFYRYRPDILEEWNVSPKENASLAFGLRYTTTYFPTSTDLQTYVNEFGNTVWESSTTAGMWPTKKPIHLFEFLGRVGISKNTSDYLALRLKAGQSLATGGLAYGNKTPREKPITGLLEIAFSGKWENLSFGLEFGRSVWGPEDWHRRFGETIDGRYRSHLAINTSKHSNLDVSYIKYREIDSKFLAPELGPFDELIFTFTYYLAGQKGFF